jgi:hypothetical protein
MRRFALLFALLAAACASPRSAATTARTAALVLAALDQEALYTVAGGLKPMSQGLWQGKVVVAAPDLAEVAAVRAALAPWRNETLWVDVQVFATPHDGARAAMAYVIDRRALAATLAAHHAFFAPYGLGPDSHPAEVVAIVERMPPLDRHRGQGLLFGYPQHAIDFFVESARNPPSDGKPTPRRFVQIPTFARATGRFVYAVAADAPEHPDDTALATAAARILARYRELRAGLDASDAAAVLGVAAALQAEFGAAVAIAR